MDCSPPLFTYSGRDEDHAGLPPPRLSFAWEVQNERYHKEGVKALRLVSVIFSYGQGFHWETKRGRGGWMGGWMGGQMDGWTNGWMGGWMGAIALELHVAILLICSRAALKAASGAPGVGGRGVWAG